MQERKIPLIVLPKMFGAEKNLKDFFTKGSMGQLYNKTGDTGRCSFWYQHDLVKTAPIVIWIL